MVKKWNTLFLPQLTNTSLAHYAQTEILDKMEKVRESSAYIELIKFGISNQSQYATNISHYTEEQSSQ